MKKSNYTKSFLLFTHIVLGSILAIFTIGWTLNYTKNIPQGYLFSALILLIYSFTLYKSASLFNKGSIGAAYFLTISGFVALAFSEMINCSSSTVWTH